MGDRKRSQNAESYGVVPGEVKGKEMAGHAIAGVGQNLIFGLWSSYMLVFFTDVFGIAGGVAGLIMMFTRVWDAVNDPMMGVIADRTRTKWGRYRPWLMFMAIPVIIFLVLNFSTPNLSGTGKVIFAAVTYVLMSMAFTAVDVPYWTLPAAMTESVNKRTTIFSISRTTTTLASVAIGMIVIPLVNALGSGDMAQGYFRTALLIGIVGAVFYLIGFSLIREHVAPQQQEKFSFKKAVNIIATNKPLLMVILSMVISFSTTFLRQSMTIYYVQYNLGSLDLVPLFSLLSLAGMLIGMVIVPMLSKRLGGKQTIIICCIASSLLNFVFFFVGYSNLSLVMVMFVLTSIPSGVVMVLISSLIANTIEYSEWKTGSRNEGLISSSQTFASKIIIAISGGLAGLVLTIINYTPAETQPTDALNMFHICMSLLPAICMLVGILPMLFYDLTDERHAEIVKELKERKKKENAV